MTREQKKTVRGALRLYGRGLSQPEEWKQAIEAGMKQCAAEDPVWAELLQMRYIQRIKEPRVIDALFICRTTYYRKELEALSVVAVEAARRGLL